MKSDKTITLSVIAPSVKQSLVFYQTPSFLWEKFEIHPFWENFENSTPPPLIKGVGGLNMHHSENVAYYPLVRIRVQSTLKQHAIELTDQVALLLADNENNGLKQHHLSLLSIQ